MLCQVRLMYTHWKTIRYNATKEYLRPHAATTCSILVQELQELGYYYGLVLAFHVVCEPSIAYTHS